MTQTGADRLKLGRDFDPALFHRGTWCMLEEEPKREELLKSLDSDGQSRLLKVRNARLDDSVKHSDDLQDLQG